MKPDRRDEFRQVQERFLVILQGQEPLSLVESCLQAINSYKDLNLKQHAVECAVMVHFELHRRGLIHQAKELSYLITKVDGIDPVLRRIWQTELVRNLLRLKMPDEAFEYLKPLLGSDPQLERIALLGWCSFLKSDVPGLISCLETYESLCQSFLSVEQTLIHFEISLNLPHFSIGNGLMPWLEEFFETHVDQRMKVAEFLYEILICILQSKNFLFLKSREIFLDSKSKKFEKLSVLIEKVLDFLKSENSPIFSKMSELIEELKANN